MDVTSAIILVIFVLIAGLFIYGAMVDEKCDPHDYWH